MSKSELKTKANDGSVEDFLNTISDEQKRRDAFALIDLFQRATGEPPKMWGPTIIGFGERRLKYDSGRELDWMIVGFSPRKANLALYGLLDTDEEKGQLEKLGKHTTGKGCLYIKLLPDIDPRVLEMVIKDAMKRIKKA